jgi:hypothetical protein
VFRARAIVLAQAGKTVTSIEKAVKAKLAAQRGGEEAAALWKGLWALYEQGGAGAVEIGLRELRELPDGADADAQEDE